MSEPQFENIELNTYPPVEHSHRSQRQTGGWPSMRADGNPTSTTGIRSSLPGGQEPNINFYKPRESYKCFNRVLFGVILLLISALTSMGILLGHYKSQMHNSPSAPANAPTNSSAPNGTTGTNTTDLLSQAQIKSCFLVVWDVCDATYNDTNPIPQKNSTIFPDQCNYLIWWMYCQFGAGVCKPMNPYCVQEYLGPDPDQEPTPAPGDVTMIGTSTFNPSQVTETLVTDIVTNMGTASTGSGLVPVATQTFVQARATTTAT